MTATPSTSFESQPRVISLYTHPDFITPGGSLILNWVVERVLMKARQPVLQITLLDGISLIDGKVGEYDPANRVQIVAVNDSSGQIDLEVSNTAAM